MSTIPNPGMEPSATKHLSCKDLASNRSANVASTLQFVQLVKSPLSLYLD